MAVSKLQKTWSLNNLDEAVARLKQYISELEQKADETTGKIMPVKDVSHAFGRRHGEIKYYGRDSCLYHQSYKSIAATATAECDRIWEQVQKDHEVNQDALKNNADLRKRVALFMQNVGIPESYTTASYTRSGKRKDERHSAGYVSDIQRNIPVDDGFCIAERDYKRFKEDISKYVTKEEELAKEAERQKAADEQKKKAEMLRASLALKYELAFDSSFQDIRENLLGRNKYLRLAWALNRNRDDWNEGYDYAETGLGNFTVETDLDREIAADIQSCIVHWDGDGRIFRDTKWSYDALYGIVSEQDPDMLADFNLILKYY